MSNANCTAQFWAEAVMTVDYLINRCPSTAIGMKTLEELWSGHPPSLENLRVFGCVAYAHINQGKLDPRALKCMFLGYPQGVKGFRLWCMEKGQPRVLISRDVVFRESEMYHSEKVSSQKQQKGDERVQLEMETLKGQPAPDAQERSPKPTQERNTEAEVKTDTEVQNDDYLQNYLLARDRERRPIREPVRFGHADMVAFALIAAEEVEGDEPRSYSEAVNGKQSQEWVAATNEELSSLHKNGTWVPVDKPKGKKFVSCKWIFKLKEGIPGVEKARFKARLVARGFTQREGIDYNEVFSPVVKHSSIRIVLALVAQRHGIGAA